MFVPIVFIVQDQPTALLFVFSAVCLIICPLFHILLLMFVPKIMAIHHQNEEESSNLRISTMNSVATNGGSTRISMTGGLIASQKKVNIKWSNALDPSTAEPSIAEEGPTGSMGQKIANRDSSASEPS
jgi:hypothetical protein